MQRFKNGEALALRQPVYEFLCKWLVEHILVEDMQYKPGARAAE